MASFLANYLTRYGSDKPSFGKKFRTKRIEPFLSMMRDIYQKKGAVSVLDLGGTEAYWQIIDPRIFDELNVTITLFNLPGYSPKTSSPRFISVVGDATTSIWGSYDISSFDLLHSNSVIEHVGDWSKMRAFANNINDFSGGHFIQTPNFWFPLEPHCMTLFFHWLPKPWRVALVRSKALGHWKKAEGVSEAVEIVESARLLDRAMLTSLFPHSEITSEKLLFLTKSFVAIKRN